MTNDQVTTAVAIREETSAVMMTNQQLTMIANTSFVPAAFRGKVPEGKCLVPTCDNPYCINPAHQRAVTESEKSKRAAERGSVSSPVRAKKIAETKRTQGKLTVEQAREIRHSDETGPVLSARYGINRSVVNAIKRGDAWKEYSSPFAGLGGRA